MHYFGAGCLCDTFKIASCQRAQRSTQRDTVTSQTLYVSLHNDALAAFNSSEQVLVFLSFGHVEAVSELLVPSPVKARLGMCMRHNVGSAQPISILNGEEHRERGGGIL